MGRYLFSLLDGASDIMGFAMALSMAVLIVALAVMCGDYFGDRRTVARFLSEVPVLTVVIRTSLVVTVLSSVGYAFIPTQRAVVEGHLIVEGRDVVSASNLQDFARWVDSKVDVVIESRDGGAR